MLMKSRIFKLLLYIIFQRCRCLAVYNIKKHAKNLRFKPRLILNTGLISVFLYLSTSSEIIRRTNQKRTHVYTSIHSSTHAPIHRYFPTTYFYIIWTWFWRLSTYSNNRRLFSQILHQTELVSCFCTECFRKINHTCFV